MRDLSEYRVLRTLGAGAQGSVYLALDTRLMRRVVIKLFHDSELRERRPLLELEARRLSQLEGQRVAQVFEVVSSGPHLALIMRYVPGCDLAQLLEAHGRLRPANVIALAIDLAGALASARQQLLVHGDMKPGNVLLGLDGRAVLSDFAIAVCSGRQARSATESALTPEHFRDVSLSQQSDFFALGMLLYRMLCGRHPFALGSGVDREKLLAGFTQEVPLPGGLPDEFVAGVGSLLRWMMAANPGDRPSGTVPLRNALRELRLQLSDSPALREPVAALARSEQQDAAAPVLPRRLTTPPRRERWWRTIKGVWRHSTPGAQVTFVLSLCALLALPGMYWIRPGPCIEILPTRSDVSPLLAPILPPVDRVEVHMLRNIRRWASPVLVLGDISGSDSRPSIRRQGVRDRCVAERSMQLYLRCWGESCRLELTSRGPRIKRESAMVLPAAAGLIGMQQGVDQLMAAHVAALFPR